MKLVEDQKTESRRITEEESYKIIEIEAMKLENNYVNQKRRANSVLQRTTREELLLSLNNNIYCSLVAKWEPTCFHFSVLTQTHIMSLFRRFDHHYLVVNTTIW